MPFLLLLPALLPVLLGGGFLCAPWIIVALLALLTLLVPAAAPLPGGRPLALSCGVLFLAAAAAFLPASLANCHWRETLTQAAIVPPGGFLTPQPWITGENLLLLLSGLLALRLFLAVNSTASLSTRQRALAAFSLALGLLAALGLAVQSQLLPAPPGWILPPCGMGPFANRNQTGNLLSLGALGAIACLVHHVRKRQFLLALPHLAALALCVLGAIATTSRSGLLMLGLVLALWPLFLLVAQRHRRRRSRPASAGLVLAGLLTLASLLASVGWVTVARFNFHLIDFRLLMWADLPAMLADSPWTGLGLGNFDGVFPFFRQLSASPSRALHPDSGWLWLLAELGLPGLLAAVASLVLLLRALGPLRPGPRAPLHSLALAATLGFAAHSLLDVSTHGFGALLPALFLLTLGLPAPANPPPAVPAPHPLLRLLPLLPALPLLAYALPQIFLAQPPGSASVARLQALLIPVSTHSESSVPLTPALLAAHLPDLDSALRVRPLDPLLWQLHAHALAANFAAHPSGPRPDDAIQADFTRALLLEPFHHPPAQLAGAFWLSLRPPRPDLAIPLWREALRRLPLARPDPQDRRNFLARLIEQSAASGQSYNFTARLLGSDLSLWRDFAFIANSNDLPSALDVLTLNDRAFPGDLPPADLSALARHWYDAGDRDDLFSCLVQLPPETLRSGPWPTLARLHADQHDLPAALRLALDNLPPPVLPPVPASERPRLRTRSYQNPDDLAVATQLCAAELADPGPDPDAALRLLRKILLRPDCPPRLRLLAAHLMHTQGAPPEETWATLLPILQSAP